MTSNPERQDRARERYPDAAIRGNIDELWTDHDLVVIGTPNRFHVPIALLALEAGLHVVIDKPMAPAAAEGQRAVAEAEARGLVLSVFQNRRWDGDFRTLRRLIDDGELGEVVRFESRFERWLPEVPQDAWRERSDPEEAGGVLFDLGSHLIDQSVQLFGPPTRVYAEVDRRRPGAGVDDDAFVALEHPNGARSHLWMNVFAAIRGPRMRVLGTKATYEKYGLDVQEAALAHGMIPGDPAWGREPSDAWGQLATDEGARTVETEPGAYEDFYRGIVAAIRRSGPVPVDPIDSIEVVRIIEAAFDSARTRSVTTFEPSLA